MAAQKRGRIFISHTKADTKLAGALTKLLGKVLLDRVEVNYSTSKELGSAPRAGEDWFRWIEQEVRLSEVAFVLLTPASVQSPWILWESGAVYGVSLTERARSPGSKAARNPRVRPLAFQIGYEEFPNPFQRIQVSRGDRFDEMDVLMQDLASNVFGNLLSVADAQKAGRLQKDALDAYMKEVQDALLMAPLTPTEATVQEWLGRIEQLKGNRRQSEAATLQHWLEVAFGRDTEEERKQDRPLDFRLHRALGELYLEARQYERAVKQFELARRMVPRDLYILRKLGQAQLNLQAVDDAHKTVAQIEKLVPTACEENVECAALKARCYMERGGFTQAIAVLAKAREKLPESDYLADLLGQAALEARDLKLAKVAYNDVIRLVSKAASKSLWNHASLASAHLVLGSEAQAIIHLKAVGNFDPPPKGDELEAIERGLRRIQRATGKSPSATKRWIDGVRAEN